MSEWRKTYRVGPYEVHEGVDDAISLPSEQEWTLEKFAAYVAFMTQENTRLREALRRIRDEGPSAPVAHGIARAALGDTDHDS